MNGKKVTDIKDKANIPYKIACKLQELKVEGWIGMQIYHLQGSEKKLFKSLQDLVKRELKQFLSPSKETTPGEMPDSSMSDRQEKEEIKNEPVI